MDNTFLRYRITYEKSGVARYIGHLDLVRVFQRAIRRAGLNPRYSEGFNPHIILSFASPLSVGMSGLAEIAEIELLRRTSREDIISGLNSVFPQGLKARECVGLTERDKPAASLLRAAVYRIHVRAYGFEPNLEDAAARFLAAERLEANVARPGEPPKIADIRGLVHSLSLRGNVAEATLACGGGGNLKPSVLAETLCGMTGGAFDKFSTEYSRLELIL